MIRERCEIPVPVEINLTEFLGKFCQNILISRTFLQKLKPLKSANDYPLA